MAHGPRVAANRASDGLESADGWKAGVTGITGTIATHAVITTDIGAGKKGPRKGPLFQIAMFNHERTRTPSWSSLEEVQPHQNTTAM